MAIIIKSHKDTLLIDSTIGINLLLSAKTQKGINIPPEAL